MSAKKADQRTKLTHVVGIVTIMIIVIWGYVLMRLVETNSPNFMAAFTPFVGFAGATLTGFFKWIEGDQSQGTK